MKKFIVLALIVNAVGVTLGYFLGLSDFWSAVLGLAPAMLVAFPFMKRWMPKATFKQWVLTVGLCVIFAWLFYLASARLVGS